MEFDEKNVIKKKFDNPDLKYPIKVEFDGPKNELIICTRKDIRYYSLINGRMKFSFVGLLEDPSEHDITVFKCLD